MGRGVDRSVAVMIAPAAERLAAALAKAPGASALLEPDPRLLSQRSGEEVPTMREAPTVSAAVGASWVGLRSGY